MERKIYNLIILDESGSMSSIARATVSGLNETLQTIRQAQEKHPEQAQIVSLMSFNSGGRKYHYDLKPVSEIGAFDGKDYEPSDCTPLYDAIGFGISKLRRSVGDDDQALVTIITDGLENSSHEYSYKSITSLMDTMKERGWMITYIGANQDAVRVAREMHIDNGLNYDASEEGVGEMMRVNCCCISSYYDAMASCANPQKARRVSHNYNFFGRRKDGNGKEEEQEQKQ